MKRVFFVIVCSLVFVVNSNASELVDDVVELAKQHPIKACLIQTDRIGLITSEDRYFANNNCQYGGYNVTCVNKVLYYYGGLGIIAAPVVDGQTLQFVRCQNVKLSNKILQEVKE